MAGRQAPRITSLTFKVIMSVTAIVTLMSSLTTLVYVVSASTRLRAAQQRQSQQLAAGFAAAAIEPLLANDYPILETALQGILQREPEVRWVRLRGPDGQPLLERAQPDQRSMAADGTMPFTRTIRYQGTSLGTLEFGWSVKTRSAEMRQTVAVMIGMGIATVFAVTVLLIIILRLLILRPVTRLRDFAERLQAGQWETAVTWPSRDELGDLARALDAMARSLHASQRALEEERNRLELTVRERTAALAASNQQLQDNLTRLRDAQTQILREKDELESLNTIMMGREQRILELKAEVNELLEGSGKPHRYGTESPSTA